MNNNTLPKVKTITSYTGHARFIAELDKFQIGFIPRQPINSPYCYSPSHIVHQYKGMPVILVETKHKHYEVFKVSSLTIYKTDKEATDIYIKAVSHA